MSRSIRNPIASNPTPPSSSTHGGDLERVRLEHRAHRMQLVIVALRERSGSRSHRHSRHKALGQAIEGFVHELHAVRGRLAELERRPGRRASG